MENFKIFQNQYDKEKETLQIMCWTEDEEKLSDMFAEADVT